MNENKSFRLALILCLFGFVAACGTTKQARGVKAPLHPLLGFDPQILTLGKKDQMLLIYVSPNVDIRKYHSIYIDPILYQKPEKASPASLAELQKLANNLYAYIQDELKNDFTLDRALGPGAIRLQMAFYNPRKRAVVSNCLTSAVPVGVIPSIVKDFATGKALSVGEASAEIKITDALTGELLGAAIDRRIGEKYSKEAFTSWGDVDQAFRAWAKKIHLRFCEIARKDGCGAP